MTAARTSVHRKLSGTCRRVAQLGVGGGARARTGRRIHVIGWDLEVTDWRGMRNLEDLNLYAPAHTPASPRGRHENCEFA